MPRYTTKQSAMHNDYLELTMLYVLYKVVRCIYAQLEKM